MCSHWLKGVHWFYRYVSYPQQSVIKCVINVHNIQGRLHANLLLQTYPAFATTIKIHKKSNLEVKNDVLYKFIVQRVVALQSFRGKKHIVTLSMWQCASLKKSLKILKLFFLCRWRKSWRRDRHSSRPQLLKPHFGQGHKGQSHPWKLLFKSHLTAQRKKPKVNWYQNFFGKVGFNPAIGLATSCCSHGDLDAVGWSEGP